MITRHQMKLLQSTAEGMIEGKAARQWSKSILFKTGEHPCKITRVYFDAFFNKLTIQFICKMGRAEYDDMMRQSNRELIWMNVPFQATAFVKVNGVTHSNAYTVHATVDVEPRNSLWSRLVKKFRR